jgi:hypothetical protein
LLLYDKGTRLANLVNEGDTTFRDFC